MTMQTRMLATVLVLMILIPTIVKADIGPKPVMDIYVKQAGEPLKDNQFYAQLLACDNEAAVEIEWHYTHPPVAKLLIKEYDAARDCWWYTDRLAWGGKCTEGKCTFTYMVPSPFKLAVYLPSEDKVYLSGATSRKGTGMDTVLEANLLPSGGIETKVSPLQVTSRRQSQFIFAVVLTLIIELLAAWLYLKNRIEDKKNRFKILLTVAAGSLITLPVVWFVIPMMSILLGLYTYYVYIVIAGEAFAVLFEGWLIYFVNKNVIPFKEALTLSLVINICSYFIGGVFGV